MPHRFKIKNTGSVSLRIIGLVTTLSDYKLCWQLNKNFNWNLQSQDYILPLKNNSSVSTITISHFYNKTDNKNKQFHVIANRSNNHFLLPELKNLDYLMISKHDFYYTSFDEFKNQIRSIKEIRAVFSINSKEIKKTERLEQIIDHNL